MIFFPIVSFFGHHDQNIHRKVGEDHFGVSILRPQMEDARVIAQDGWFTVHSVSRKYQKFVPLGELEHHAEGMVKIKIVSYNILLL